MTTKIAHVHHHSTVEALKHLLNKASVMFNAWHERHRTRQQLAEMPTYLLRDIGLTEVDRQRELNKRFWQD